MEITVYRIPDSDTVHGRAYTPECRKLDAYILMWLLCYRKEPLGIPAWALRYVRPFC
jgi:hypothetical protein